MTAWQAPLTEGRHWCVTTRVNRSSSRLSTFFGLLLASLVAASAGCGSSGGPTGDPQATLASCNAWCDAYIPAACAAPIYTALDACKMTECSDLPRQPAICQTKIKTYYDCRKAQADLCGDMACTDEFNAVLTCQ